MRHVGLNRLVEREARAPAEGLAPHRTVVEIAHGAVDPVTGIGVKDQLALDPELLDHLRGDGLGQLVGAVYRPELRHHQVRLHVVKPPGADGAQLMDADDPAAHPPIEHLALTSMLSFHLLQNVLIADWAPPLLILGLLTPMVLAVDRLGLAGDQPVEWRQTRVRADRFSVTASFSTRDGYRMDPAQRVGPPALRS